MNLMLLTDIKNLIDAQKAIEERVNYYNQLELQRNQIDALMKQLEKDMYMLKGRLEICPVLEVQPKQA